MAINNAIGSFNAVLQGTTADNEEHWNRIKTRTRLSSHQSLLNISPFTDKSDGYFKHMGESF